MSSRSVGNPSAQASIFEGVPLIERVPRYPKYTQLLLANGPGSTRLREIIDSWLSTDPPAYRSEMQRRLVNDRNGLGAFYELLVRQALRQLLGEPQREPEGLPCEGNPDYGVKVSGRRVVVEVTTLEEIVTEEQRKRREITAALDGISGPWHLMLHWTQCTDLDDVPPKRVVDILRKHIASLAPGKHEVDLRVDDAKLRATVLPASKVRSSIVSMDASMGVKYSPGDKQIREDVREKTKRYRGLKAAGIPLIVAIGTDLGYVDAETIYSALFGDETLVVTMENDEIKSLTPGPLNYAGLLTPARAGDLRHTTLTATWLVRWRLRGMDLMGRIVHIPNPWAANPLDWQDDRVATLGHERTGTNVQFFPPSTLPEIQLA
jgi:hypothetical protein